jgi:hypothetical protein
VTVTVSVKNSIIETCDTIFLNQMYFGRKDKTPMLEVEPKDEIVDAGDLLLAKDEGSDSDDKPEPPTAKYVRFASAVDTIQSNRQVLTKLHLWGLLLVHHLYPHQLLNLKLY